jgi:hypothetical protein
LCRIRDNNPEELVPQQSPGGNRKSLFLPLKICFFIIVLSFQIFGRFRKMAKGDYELRDVRPSAWNNSAPTGRDFHEIRCLNIFRKSVKKIQV